MLPCLSKHGEGSQIQGLSALVCGWTDNHLLKIIHLIGGVEGKCKQEHKAKERRNFHILAESVGLSGRGVIFK